MRLIRGTAWTLCIATALLGVVAPGLHLVLNHGPAHDNALESDHCHAHNHHAHADSDAPGWHNAHSHGAPHSHQSHATHGSCPVCVILASGSFSADTATPSLPFGLPTDIVSASSEVAPQRADHSGHPLRGPPTRS